MSTTLAIVAYRNPIEEWLWESGAAYWLILGALGIVLSVFGYYIISEKIRRWRNRK